jgi:hypothetical protein
MEQRVWIIYGAIFILLGIGCYGAYLMVVTA